MKESTLLIVGAGHAGIRAALSARTGGYKGNLTIIADEGCSLPYERPPLSKWTDSSELSKAILPVHQLDEMKVPRVTAVVKSINTESQQLNLENGTALRYDRLLLATGASPRRLSVPGASSDKVFYLRNKVDALQLQKAAQTAGSAIIIGGGFIGLEVAASLRGLGVEVNVIEQGDRLLERAVSSKVASIVQELHENQGVVFTFGAQVKEINSGSKASVRLGNGAALSADLIIVGIGSIPNTKLAESAGLSVDNGIVVDSCLRTSDPNIFAAGDCCSFPLYDETGPLTRLESWQAAGEQGDIAGRNMLATKRDCQPCSLTPWLWSVQYDHTLQMTGMPGFASLQIDRNYAPSHHVTFGQTEDGKLVSASGIAPGTSIAKDIRFSMKLIRSGQAVDATALAAADIKIKSLIQK